MDGLEAFTSARLDWTASLNQVWTDSPVHVEGVHREVIDEVLEKWGWMEDPDVLNPLGTIILGEAGAGKTHLVSAIRREIIGRGGLFLLGDMTDVRDFWETVNQGIVNSLLRPLPDGTTQLAAVLSSLLARFGGERLGGMGAEDFAGLRPPALENRLDELLQGAARLEPEVRRHADELKALMLLGSSELSISQVGLAWLGGLDVSEEGLLRHALPPPTKRASDRVRSLSWVISQRGPMVFAVDQLDAIASEARAYKEAGRHGGASLVYHEVVRGMMELWDVLERTLVVATSLETNWRFLEANALAPVADRYSAFTLLHRPDEPQLREILARRLARHYARVGFEAPYPAYPFKPESFRGLSLTPRQLLRRAEDHRVRCRRAGRVEELERFEVEVPSSRPDRVDGRTLDRRFEETARAVDAPALLDGTDQELELLVKAACRCLIIENPLPPSHDAVVDLDFGSTRIPSLHARIRIVDHHAGDRERHASFRFIQHGNAIAFQTRLERALTESGISEELPFRRLVILRKGPPPRGAQTAALVKTLRARGGRLVEPGLDELRRLEALRRLLVELPPGLEAWLRDRRPVSQMMLFRDLVPFSFAVTTEPEPPSSPAAAPPKARSPSSPAAPEAPQGPPGRASDAFAFARTPAPRSTTSAPPGGVRPPPLTGDLPVVATHPPGSRSVERAEPKMSAPRDPASATAPDPRPAVGPVPEIDRDGRGEIPTEPTLKTKTRARSTRGSASTASVDDVAADRIPLGTELSGLGPGAPVELRVGDLVRHVAVVAAAGSGKTVFVRRLVEEAALRGIPSVVVDVANDLVRFREPWPPGAAPPPGPEPYLVRDFFERTETVVWTPGWQGGNPLSSDPLPDFGPLLADPDELNAAIDLAHQALASDLKLGSTATAQTKRAILRRAIDQLARRGGASLDDLADLLAEPPSEVTAGFQNGTRLTSQLASGVRAAMELNPLLRTGGEQVDFDRLYGLGEPRTRISVVNLAGLSTLDHKQAFVGRLMTSMFTWVRRTPAQERPKGLVVIDEAKDFAPASRSVPSREPLKRLAAQARKYGLGMVVATQEPKSIHNQVVSNCSTQLFGKALSPAAQDAVRGMLAQLGGEPTSLASLKTGQFHCAVPGHPPRKIATRICLSHHPKNPPSLDEVRTIAAEDRQRLDRPS